MKYIENEFVELKSSLTDELKYEIVEFLNSYLGGTIYIGVNNNGIISNLSQSEKDINESKIINWIRDESIYPNCSEFVSVKYNNDGVLVVSINPGNNKPYYVKEKGPKPSGVYIRYGRNKSQASHEEITRMIMESNHVFYEEKISSVQRLTFKFLKLKFEEKNLDFNDFKMITSGFIKDGKYTNLAFIFSDQYDVETKIAIYTGMDRSIFKSKKEFNGSIVNQIDKTMEYFELCNETRIVIDGSPMRKEYVSYYEKAYREAILNCYCHRDYSKRSNIKIEFFDDRCEIISPGGFYGGLTLKEALSGVQSFRNKFLVQLLHRLGYIENYSSGLNRIFKEYYDISKKPVVETSLNMFKVIFPNLNYKFNEIDFNFLDDLNVHKEESDEPIEMQDEPLEVEFEPLEDKFEPLEVKSEPLEAKTEPLETEFEPLKLETEPLEVGFESLEAETETLGTEFEPLGVKSEPLEVGFEPLEIETEPLENEFEPLEAETEPLEAETEPLEIQDNKTIEDNVVQMIKTNSYVRVVSISECLGVSISTIKRIIKVSKRIRRVGSKRYGYWKIIE